MAGADMWVLAAALATLLACVSPLFAQTEDPFSIRVESDQVIVHVEVANKLQMGKPPSEHSQKCNDALQAKFHFLLPSEPYLAWDCSDWLMYGLSASDFSILEDGIEQHVLSAILEPLTYMTARDNRGSHEEWSYTPKGKWSSADVSNMLPAQTLHYYNIAYVPSRLSVGKCHRIEIRVKRPNAVVFAPNQYCYIPHSPSDPLLGTDFGQELERELNSTAKPKIPLSVRANFIYVEPKKARIYMVAEFPWDHLKHQWVQGDLKGKVGVLNTIYNEEHHAVSRFSDSDFAGISVGPHVGTRSGFDYEQLDSIWLPSRYETQVDLPSGQYYLRVVLSDGEKFGRADVPISIDDYDGKQLALSSVILFKRYRVASAAAQETAHVKLAPEYVPLVSQDQQITPTADPTFLAKELVPVYFEVYDPFLASEPAITVRAHARIVSVKSGEIRNFNWFDVAEFRRPGTTTFAIAKAFDPSGLPKGEYRLEVQASDSAGHTTPWRSATFTLH